MKSIGYLCLIFLLINVSSALAQINTDENGSLNGRVYSDFYWMAQHHNSDIEGQNGFWFRRIYMTYDYEFGDSFSSRLRLEAASAGDFQSGNELVPSIKDAYLKWENSSHQIYAGISSTPTFGLTEDVWGYRSIQKSPQDLYDFGSSRDFGLSFKGELGEADKWNYHFFVGNGNSNRDEINKGKKVMFALAYNITDHLVIEGYMDWNDTADDPNNQDSYTAQGFAGYQSETVNVGALYSYQQREPNLGGPDQKLDLVSLFGNVTFNDSVKGFLRADHLFDSYQGGSGNAYLPFAEDAESTYLVGGADIQMRENIHVMPNVEAIVYGENSSGQIVPTDIIPRLTLYYNF